MVHIEERHGWLPVTAAMDIATGLMPVDHGGFSFDEVYTDDRDELADYRPARRIWFVPPSLPHNAPPERGRDS